MSLQKQLEYNKGLFVYRVLSNEAPEYISNLYTHTPSPFPIFIASNKDYPKRAQNISSIQPIRNNINDLINECNIAIKSIPVLPTSPQMPQWEHINARFDTDYTDLKKSESTNILAIQVRGHLNNIKIILRFLLMVPFWTH